MIEKIIDLLNKSRVLLCTFMPQLPSSNPSSETSSFCEQINSIDSSFSPKFILVLSFPIESYLIQHATMPLQALHDLRHAWYLTNAWCTCECQLFRLLLFTEMSPPRPYHPEIPQTPIHKCIAEIFKIVKSFPVFMVLRGDSSGCALNPKAAPSQ